MKISYDPDADAAYVQLVEPRDNDRQTTVNADGVIIDWDAHGSPRGYEFLSVRDKGLPVGGLPDSIGQAVKDFISSGALGSSSMIEREYE